MKEKVVTEIRKTLKECVDEKVIKSSKRYFKEGEEPLTYGVGMKEIGIIGKEFYNQIHGSAKKEIFEICEELWKSNYLEEAIIACTFSYSLHQQYEPSDFLIFEHWIKEYVANWADCDTFCNHTVGTFVMMYPEYIAKLKEWTKSPNR